jgi:CubicO group peptidase (beta-lactamase class C family)
VQAPSGKYRNVKPERPITIRDLLTHTSGLSYSFMPNEHIGALYKKAGVSDGLVETKGTMADNVATFARLPLANHPGKAWNYGLSTDALGHVIEKVSSKTLAEFLDERIFTPLDMKDTGFRVAEEDEARLATVYQPNADDQAIEPMPEGPLTRGNLVYSTTYPLDRESKFFWDGFFSTLFWVDPEQKLVGVLMTQLQPYDHLDLWPAFRARVYEAFAAN